MKKENLLTLLILLALVAGAAVGQFRLYHPSSVPAFNAAQHATPEAAALARTMLEAG